MLSWARLLLSTAVPFVLVSAALLPSALASSAPLPFVFVPNVGQSPSDVRYVGHGPHYTVDVTDRGLRFAFAPMVTRASSTAPPAERRLALAFVGARLRPVVDARESSAAVNYFIGADPRRWRTGVPAADQLVYRDVWPGIDLVLRGEAGRLKYEFVVAPGASVSAIRLAYEGARRVAVDPSGDLRVETAGGVLTDARPVTYQTIDGRRVAVPSRFVTGAGATRTHGFAVGTYDPTVPLVVDPGLLYATFVGGTGGEKAFGVAADATGAVYVVGTVESPTTAGAPGTRLGRLGRGDVFVAKVNPSASGAASLVYLTYIGGADADIGRAIAVDGQGNAYVTGQTASADFPTTTGAFSTKLAGRGDAFVAKLGASGGSLVYATFLGGGGPDEGRAIAVACAAVPNDGTCEAHVTGWTQSSNFPITPFAVFAASQGRQDAFVTKLTATGAALGYSTYLGGTGTDIGHGIALACAPAGAAPPACSAWVAGETASSNFPTTAAAFDTAFGGSVDGFATRLNAAGDALEYSTFLGGTGADRAHAIATNAQGLAYVTGAIASPSFGGVTPVAIGPGGGTDAFVARLDSSLAGTGSLGFLARLGGAGQDIGYGIGLRCDATGCEPIVVGETASSDFPVSVDATSATFHGAVDAFVARVAVAGTTAPFATYLGGAAADRAYAVAVETAGRVHVVGETASSDFPTTAGAFHTAFGMLTDAFVATLDLQATAPPPPPPGSGPTATDDTVSSAQNATLVFPASDLLANDTPQATGQTLTVTAVSATSTAGGTASLSGANVTYVPPENFTGTDTFTYTVCDDASPPGCATGTVTVAVSAADRPPVVNATDQTVNEGVLLTFTVTAGDPDTPSATLPVTATDLPRGATFDASTGQVSWTPTSAQAGVYFVAFRAAADGTTIARTIRITVNDTIVDSDLDDVPDASNPLVGRGPDNCRDVPNTDQSDVNDNGVGDVCDPHPNAFDAVVTTSVVSVSAPALDAGHAEGERIVATVAVTFNPSDNLAGCYFGARPTPYNIVLEVLDAAGHVVLAQQIQEGPPFVIALAPAGDLVAVCRVADPSNPGSVAGPRTLTADVPITDWHILAPGRYVVRAEYVAVGLKDLDLNRTGGCSRDPSECYAPIWQGLSSGSLSLTIGDQCPTSGAGFGQGPGGTGCPVADKIIVTRRGTGAPVPGAQIRVFDRNSPAFRAVIGGVKNPDRSLYPTIFESDAGRVGTCVTAANGICFAGEEAIGDLFVIVKARDSNGQVVYDGKPKSPSDFDATGVAVKDFQIP